MDPILHIRITRQESKLNTAASSQANRERLKAKLRAALSSINKAFEEAYTLEQPELMVELLDHLVNLTIPQITSLFTSSRCRTCYHGQHQSAAWRQSRFNTLPPILCEVPLKAHNIAEAHQAVVILEKTSIETDGPPSEKFRLGLSKEDWRIYVALACLEGNSFDEDLKNLFDINSLIRMSLRWDSQKDTPHSLEVNLNYAALQRIRQLRHQNLLPITQALLHRY